MSPPKMLPPLPSGLSPEDELKVEILRRAITQMSRQSVQELAVSLLEQSLYYKSVAIALMTPDKGT